MCQTLQNAPFSVYRARTSTMTRDLFEEYVNELGSQLAIEIAEGSGIPKDRINKWLNTLTYAMCEDVGA